MSRYAEGGEVRPHDPGDSVPGALTDEVSTDTVVVDREALANAMQQALYPGRNVPWADVSPTNRRIWLDTAAKVIASGILRDVREVQHEHGERIAKAIDGLAKADRDATTGTRIVYSACSKLARLPYPPP